mmetsp:Transcript_33387/g.72073  ORF Transcript_33387/g.72073 Transcript_33387/m.72073 type:complete len:436 (-) Transcript_33387:23-1330(-)
MARSSDDEGRTGKERKSSDSWEEAFDGVNDIMRASGVTGDDDEDACAAAATASAGSGAGVRSGRKEWQGLERYARWYRANEQWIAPIEQALQSAIWFLPDAGAGASGELRVEVLHSVVSMWTVLNEQALLVTEKGDREAERLRTVEKRFPQALLPLLVATIEQFETVVECVLVHKLEQPGEAAAKASVAGSLHARAPRYKWLTLVEAVKATLRLVQLYKSGGKTSCMLLDGGLSGVGNALDTSCREGERRRNEAFQAFRARYLMPPMGGPGLPRNASRRPSQQVAKGSSTSGEDADLPAELDLSIRDAHLLTFAEMLQIVRPVVYCSLLWRDGHGSWRPWLSSLACEVSSLVITNGILRRSASLGGNLLCSREQDARWARLVLYLARSPFYDSYTKRTLVSIRDRLKPVPLLGMASNAGFNLLDDIQSYYTYTSG